MHPWNDLSGSLSHLGPWSVKERLLIILQQASYKLSGAGVLHILFDARYPEVVSVCRHFRLFCVFFVLSTVHTCHALLTYNRQALLYTANSHSLPVFTGFIPPDLQLIVRFRSHHHHPREGPGALSRSELTDPRRALRRRRRKRGKRGGLHARLKACASRPPLPSLLLANVRSLENKLDELRARTGHTGSCLQ